MKKLSNPLMSASLLFAVLWLPPVEGADLMEIYRLSLGADPSYRAAGFEHQASREVLTQAWADYRPAVTFDYDEIDTTQDIISSENSSIPVGEDASFPTSTWTLTVTQPLFRYANYVRIGQAKDELEQADAEQVKAQQDLLLRTAEVYLAVLTAEDAVTFIEAERSAVEKQLELARAQEDARTGRLVDRLDAEARMATVEADLAYADVAARDAKQAVFELTGQVPETLASLGNALELVAPIPSDERQWLELANKQNPGLVFQRHAVAVASADIKRQNAGHMPTLDLVYTDSNRDTGSTLFGGGSNVQTQELMLSLNLPLYLGGSVSSKSRQAIAKHSSALEELTRLARESQRQTLDAYWGVTSAIKRVDSLGLALRAQQETLKLKQLGFESGLNTVLTVLDAERDLSSVRKDYAKARYDYLLNGLRLKALVGALIEDDLQAINRLLQG
ncbi:MAG: outer membrane protein [Motiliproteus sp.]|jgi:outer membrane protein